MSDEGFYTSRERFTSKSDRLRSSPKQSKTNTISRDRLRRSNNSGLRRLFHLVKKESGRKFLIGLILVVILFLLVFSWFYSF